MNTGSQSTPTIDLLGLVAAAVDQHEAEAEAESEEDGQDSPEEMVIGNVVGTRRTWCDVSCKTHGVVSYFVYGVPYWCDNV